MKYSSFGGTKLVIAAAMVWSGAASAQSSVTVYGLLDAGMTYTNKSTAEGSRGSAVQFMSGTAQGDRLGFKGTEELGGGTKALFALEMGFQLANGQLGQGGRAFGRSSYVGLSGAWGELTLGRQYDFIGWFMPAYATGANTPAGLLAWSLPTYAAGGYSLDNRIRHRGCIRSCDARPLTARAWVSRARTGGRCHGPPPAVCGRATSGGWRSVRR